MIKTPKKICVIYNTPAGGVDSERVLGDLDTVLTANEVVDALKLKGFDARVFGLESPMDLKKIDADLVFNLCEWTGVETHKSCEVLTRLEKLKIPYTGATAKNYFETGDKVQMKKRLDELGLPTPGWVILEKFDDKLPVNMKYPMIVKLGLEHGSVGLTQNSVVENEDQLRGQAETMIRKYKQPVLVEEFIVGRELNATLIGNGDGVRVLPITEMDFSALTYKWNILTFSSKFLDRTEEYKETKPVYPPRDMESGVIKAAEELAKRAFWEFECQDYTRLDMRVDKNGQAWILEVNSNPSLENAWISSMVSANIAGLEYEDIIEQIVLAAWSRYATKKTEMADGEKHEKNYGSL